MKGVAAVHPIWGCDSIPLEHGFTKRAIRGREVIKEIWYSYVAKANYTTELLKGGVFPMWLHLLGRGLLGVGH